MLPKVPFFFPGIVYRHSLTRFSIFFFHFLEKKKTSCFFFSQEKFAGHSLAWGADIYKKRSKTRIFCNFFTFWSYFIFSNFFFRRYFYRRSNLHRLCYMLYLLLRHPPFHLRLNISQKINTDQQRLEDLAFEAIEKLIGKNWKKP